MLDVFQNLNGLVEVAQKRVQPEEAFKREVSQHLVKTVAAKVSSNRVGVSLVVVHFKLFVDIGLVHKRVQDIEHRVDIPNLRVPFQGFNFVFRLLGKLAAELTERLELIDELVNDLPQPLVGQLKVDRGVGGQDVVEELAVVVVALKPLLDSWASLKKKHEEISGHSSEKFGKRSQP